MPFSPLNHPGRSAMNDEPEELDLPAGIPEVVTEEADELILEARAAGDPDAIDELAMDLLDGLGEYDQGADFGLLLVDELRRRAAELRERPQ
jgi:hypothetical protein